MLHLAHLQPHGTALTLHDEVMFIDLAQASAEVSAGQIGKQMRSFLGGHQDHKFEDIKDANSFYDWMEVDLQDFLRAEEHNEHFNKGKHIPVLMNFTSLDGYDFAVWQGYGCTMRQVRTKVLWCPNTHCVDVLTPL